MATSENLEAMVLRELGELDIPAALFKGNQELLILDILACTDHFTRRNIEWDSRNARRQGIENIEWAYLNRR